MTDPRTTFSADLRACRDRLRGGSKTFFAASLVLPLRVRKPAIALYAFCRVADDEVDLAEDGQEEALQRLYARLDRIYSGNPMDFAEDRALSVVVADHGIPQSLLAALLEGIGWDAKGREYETESELLAYAARVAGTVGTMMALLMGRRDEAALARACDLGIGMQLSNIARDVGEDARNGRIYVPREWLRDAGIDPEAFLADPKFDDRLTGPVRRLLESAELHYRRSETGIAALPADCRTGIFAARMLYADIGGQVRRNGYDSISRRAVVSTRRKLALLLGAWLRAWLRRRPLEQPTAQEACFLVDAAAAAPAGRETKLCIDDRLGWTLELFARLDAEAAERRRGPAAAPQEMAGAD